MVKVLLIVCIITWTSWPGCIILPVQTFHHDPSQSPSRRDKGRIPCLLKSASMSDDVLTKSSILASFAPSTLSDLSLPQISVCFLVRCTYPRPAQGLSHSAPWPAYTPRQVDIPRHNGDSFRMHGTQIPTNNLHQSRFTEAIPDDLTYPRTGGP